MQSKAATVSDFLASLPPDRRAAIEEVRAVILKNLDTGFAESMQYGMIGYCIPHSVFPPGYHCDPRQPLPYAGLASQKNHMSLYLMCIYGHGDTASQFRKDWEKTGKKLDMGKACIRFKKVDDLALDVIGATIKRITVKKYLDQYAKAMASMGKDLTGKKVANAPKKPSPAKTAKNKTPKKAASRAKR